MTDRSVPMLLVLAGSRVDTVASMPITTELSVARSYPLPSPREQPEVRGPAARTAAASPRIRFFRDIVFLQDSARESHGAETSVPGPWDGLRVAEDSHTAVYRGKTKRCTCVH